MNFIQKHSPSKADVLHLLMGRLKSASVLPQLTICHEKWSAGPSEYMQELSVADWAAQGLLAVRSSADGEDSSDQSLAGKYLSKLNVRNPSEVMDAVNEVFSSFGIPGARDQVFIQQMIEDATMHGVIFTYDPNTSAPYFIVNYDTKGTRTDTVTSGAGEELRTFIHHRSAPHPDDPRLGPLICLARELEALMGNACLDIEFAHSASHGLVLLQVRPLTTVCEPQQEQLELHSAAVTGAVDKLKSMMRPHPGLLGHRSIFGNMPDWNPAEIIGQRPRQLALSLYRELVTDSIWAYQRDNYGYRNLRSFPLIHDFHGQPYVDVRVSFNSFIPKSVPEELAERLTNYYLDRLERNPALHDKVEFDVLFSCYSFDLKERLQDLQSYGFSRSDRELLKSALLEITNDIIDPKNGIYLQDHLKIEQLLDRHDAIINSDLETVGKIYWSLEECKRYGTLPFAGMARAGFVAMQILNSLVYTGIFSIADKFDFLAGLNTVSRKLTTDKQRLERREFLEKYGHLRPGSYDILSPRYDEDPNLYFDWSADHEYQELNDDPLRLSVDQLSRLAELLDRSGLDIDVLGLLNFISRAIEGREYGKFVFTKTLSDTLSLLKQFGSEFGFQPESMSHFNIRRIQEIYSSSTDAKAVLADSIDAGRRKYLLSQTMLIPPLITEPDQLWSFSQPDQTPNFITQNKVIGQTAFAEAGHEVMDGVILLIPSADPGYDWIFTKNIGGFATQYGGANSHMAIRASEMDVPAVIGAGEQLYAHWSKAKLLELDCANATVSVLR